MSVVPMVPELRRLHSPDLRDMEAERPEAPRNFCILVQAMIGPKDLPGEESFDFTVCSPAWLEESLADTTVLIGRHYLLMREYNYVRIYEVVQRICQGIRGEDWPDVAEQLAKYARWEFDAYQADRL